MVAYTARIELHFPTAEAYQSLDRAMAAVGFVRPHKSVPSLRPNLEPAEYLRESGSDLDEAFEIARDAATGLDAPFTILVCESVSQKWIGLRVSTPA